MQEPKLFLRDYSGGVAGKTFLNNSDCPLKIQRKILTIPVLNHTFYPQIILPPPNDYDAV